MKAKEAIKLMCVDCVFMALLFVGTYLLARGQAFVTAETSGYSINYSAAILWAMIALNSISQTSFYPLLALFHVFVIHRLVRCSSTRKLIVLNSIAFCIAAAAVNAVLAMMPRVVFEVYIRMYWCSISVMIVQIVVALLFIRNSSNKANGRL